MKIAIFGATGQVGRHISREATNRQHEVIALARNTGAVDNQAVEVRQFDLLNPELNIADAVHGADVVISAIGGRAAGNHNIVADTATRLLKELPEIGIDKLVWVGGAGSLLVAPDLMLMNSDGFPAEYKDEAVAMAEALDVFNKSDSPLNWTFICPPAMLVPGEKEGPYQIGKDNFLVDEKGESRISMSDYAVALLDEVEANNYPNQRIGVAYK